MARHSSHKWGLVIWLTKFAEAWCLKVVVEKLIDETNGIRLLHTDLHDWNVFYPFKFYSETSIFFKCIKVVQQWLIIQSFPRYLIPFTSLQGVSTFTSWQIMKYDLGYNTLLFGLFFKTLNLKQPEWHKQKLQNLWNCCRCCCHLWPSAKWAVHTLFEWQPALFCDMDQ